MKFLINKKYIIRHNILKLLSDKLDSLPSNPQLPKDTYIHTNELFQELRPHSNERVWQNLEYLTDIKEIGCNEKDKDSHFYILSTGRIAYFDEKYLTKGENEGIAWVYDRVKTVSIIVLLIISIYSCVKNTSEINQYQSQQIELELKLEKLQQQVELLNNQ
ncbi:MAG: hypothetical protein EA412_08495 [Chitinophagaceae bacterium]|nr:MAG: hypothetical protein EA412_08495 [Chitinophagaceae bacterium]